MQLIERTQMLSLRAGVVVEVMVMKGHSTFHKAPALMEPRDQIV